MALQSQLWLLGHTNEWARCCGFRTTGSTRQDSGARGANLDTFRAVHPGFCGWPRSASRGQACEPAYALGLAFLAATVGNIAPSGGLGALHMAPLVDPRLGDVEDDASSTKRRSLLGIAGSLLAEISIPKLLTAWLFLIVLPGVLLGVAPLIASGWLATLSGKIATPFDGIWPLLLLVLVAVLGWVGGRPLFRAAEQGFWSLNALALQPGYALCREALRHLAEHFLRPRLGVRCCAAARR